MGKSSHKSRKRRHSSPKDHLSVIKKKLARLINAVSQIGVRRPSPSRASPQEVYDSRNVSSPKDFSEGAFSRSRSPSELGAETVSARQERPNSQDVGAAKLPGRYLENIGGKTSQPLSSNSYNLSLISSRAVGQVNEIERSLTPPPSRRGRLSCHRSPS